jgi:hypothetical protein
VIGDMILLLHSVESTEDNQHAYEKGDTFIVLDVYEDKFYEERCFVLYSKLKETLTIRMPISRLDAPDDFGWSDNEWCVKIDDLD